VEIFFQQTRRARSWHSDPPFRNLFAKKPVEKMEGAKGRYQVATKNPGDLGDAPARPKPPGVLKCSEVAEERSGWNCCLYRGIKA